MANGEEDLIQDSMAIAIAIGDEGGRREQLERSNNADDQQASSTHVSSVRRRREPTGRRARRPSFFIEEDEDITPLLIIDKDNEEILPEDIVTPPDGGYGWVIVFAAFMSSLILMGNSSATFSIILEAIVEATEAAHAHVSISSIAAVSACNGACSQFAGPFAAALANKVGFRITAIVGSLLASTGYAVSWYFCQTGVPNIPMLFIFYGIIGGIGVGFMLIPASVIVGFYFERKRALATGMAYCGNGFGVTAFPPILALLIGQFGWARTILAQGGILLICAVIAILYRPLKHGKESLPRSDSETCLITSPTSPEEHPIVNDQSPSHPDDASKMSAKAKVKQRVWRKMSLPAVKFEDHVEIEEDEETRSPSPQPPAAAAAQTANEKPPERPTFLRLKSVGFVEAVQGGGSTSRQTPSTRTRRISVGLPPLVGPYLQPQKKPRMLRVKSQNVFNRPMNRDNTFFCGSIDQIQQSPQDVNNMDIVFTQLKWEQELLSAQLLGENEDSRPEFSSEMAPNDWKSKLHVVHKMLGLELFKSITFLILCGMCTLNTMGFVVPFLYLKGLAHERGYGPEDATFLVSVIGIADIVGRILAGILAMTCGNRSLFISNTAMTLGGIATILAPFCTSYTLFVVYAGAFGFYNATVSSLRTIVLVELLGLSKLTNAYGLTLCFKGLAQFCGAPLAGYLRDCTGNYNASFYLAGTFIVCAGVLCYPARIVKNWEERRAKVRAENRLLNNDT